MKNKFFALLGLCVFCFVISGCADSKKAVELKKLGVVHLNLTTGLPEQNITSLVAYANKIWAGSKTGLYAYDGVNWAIYQQKNVNSLGSNIIENLSVYDNKLWISTNNGACYNDGERFSSFYTNGRVRACIGLTGSPVVGTANGIQYRGKIWNKDLGLVENEVTSLCYDADGNIVIGTRAGLAKLDNEALYSYTGPAKTLMGSSLIEVPPSPANCQLSGNNVKTIARFGNDLAIGTTCGLTLTNLKGKWVPYKADHEDYVQKGNGSIVKEWIDGNSELPGNIVNALATNEQKNLLFVGTDQGLAILTKDHKWVKLDKYIEDFPKFNVTGLAYLNNALYVASSDGIYQIKEANLIGEDLYKTAGAAAGN
jgi:ligand-binding sensor domain-containing protein